MTRHLGPVPTTDALVRLYDAVGWSAYTADPEQLQAAIEASLIVATERDGADLIGLARLVGDGVSVVHLQDVLVHPDHQRSGIGGRLVRACLDEFPDVRQKLLLTDDESGQHAFYRSLGYGLVGGHEFPSLTAWVRYDT